jgi:hypothetical protein
MFLQKFVRNDAIKTDPPEIYNLRTVVVSLIVSLPQAVQCTIVMSANDHLRHVVVRFFLV